MARLDLTYTRALLKAAPLTDIARAVLRRAGRALPTRLRVPHIGQEAARLAADALARAPRLFTAEPLAESYRLLFPDAIERFRTRAARILAHEVELFGRAVALGPTIDWLRDPFSAKRFDAMSGNVCETGGDPKACWELARGAHLVELGCAARLCPELAGPVREEIRQALDGFFDAVPTQDGIHYASPLEVALRAIHWLGAVELAGGAGAFPRPFVERLGARLLSDAHFLRTHLEDSGVVPANHLLGDLVGLFVLAVALDGAPGARGWQAFARRRIEREAARQVGADGAHFEASTAYHRFALELLLVASIAGRAAGVTLSVGDTIHRMLGFVRGTLQPDGTEPGFGDSDDARLFPIVPRHPRDHAYLLSVGVALFGDPALRRAESPFAEEALWWVGPAAHRTWQWVPPTRDAAAAAYRDGGVHVLRCDDVYVAMRSGSYGQRGVGGHAHNDQLAVVIHAGGRPLVVDPGTGCYTGDRLMRDRFRGTGAHGTVVVGCAEQSPILPARPFALPDQARAGRVRITDSLARAELTGDHRGYRRLPERVSHRRTVVLHRSERVIIIEDHLSGHGRVPIDVRFPLAGPARLGADARARARLTALDALLGPFDPEQVVVMEGALLVPLDNSALEPRLETLFVAPRYGTCEPGVLVSLSGLLTVPRTLRVGWVLTTP